MPIEAVLPEFAPQYSLQELHNSKELRTPSTRGTDISGRSYDFLHLSSDSSRIVYWLLHSWTRIARRTPLKICACLLHEQKEYMMTEPGTAVQCRSPDSVGPRRSPAPERLRIHPHVRQLVRCATAELRCHCRPRPAKNSAHVFASPLNKKQNESESHRLNEVNDLPLDLVYTSC